MRAAVLLALLVAIVARGEAKKQPLRMKPRAGSPQPNERPPSSNSMHGAMEAFHRQRANDLSQLSEPQLEAKLRKAYAPDDVMQDIRKARYSSGNGRVRLAPKQAMIDALGQIEDWAEEARAKQLSALVVWARRAGAPEAAVAAALSPGTSSAAARATLSAVGAGSRLSRSSTRTAPSAAALANDAEALLLLAPPATTDAGRLYATAAGLCTSGTELERLNANHSALTAAASKDPHFPTTAALEQARTEREKDVAARKSEKVVAVQCICPAPPRVLYSSPAATARLEAGKFRARCGTARLSTDAIAWSARRTLMRPA
jgi:hypothetical protein